MTDERCARGTAFADLVDYWAGDADSEQNERIEAHLFDCAECAERLADVETMARGIATAVRGARFLGLITDSVLNRLSRDGMRIRTYMLEPGKTIPCAVWAGDDLIVSRIRADFTGFDCVTLVQTLGAGNEISRVADIPVPPGPGEIINAVSAERVRQLPSTRLHMVLSGTIGGRVQIIGEYGLDHAGSLTREL
jgi:hypothetical protein